MLKLKTTAFAVAAAAVLTGCQSAPKNEGETQIVMQPDGSFIVLDENGNPSDNENANAVAALLGQEMKKRNAPKELAESEIWSADENDNATHIQSGGICPASWGKFERQRQTIFKRDGSDVACGYKHNVTSASFTFYFYRNGMEAKLATEQMEIVLNTTAPTGDLSDVTKLETADGALYSRHTIHTGSDGIIWSDGVLITDDDGWQIKLRTTYPQSQALELESIAILMLKTQIGEVDETGYQPIQQEQPGDDTKSEA